MFVREMLAKFEETFPLRHTWMKSVHWIQRMQRYPDSHSKFRHESGKIRYEQNHIEESTNELHYSIPLVSSRLNQDSSSYFPFGFWNSQFLAEKRIHFKCLYETH